MLFDYGETWFEVKDGDLEAFALFKRHYSFHVYKDGRRDRIGNPNRFLFLGPGEKMVLLTPKCDAVFAWRKFIDKSGQTGLNCAVFRNESKQKASFLILEAEKAAEKRWGKMRLYTYVNEEKVKGTCPGYCFIRAGWTRCGMTKSGKLILEKNPDVA